MKDLVTIRAHFPAGELGTDVHHFLVDRDRVEEPVLRTVIVIHGGLDRPVAAADGHGQPGQAGSSIPPS